MERPSWLEQAWRELGLRETEGPGSDPRILSFYEEIGHPEIASDEVPWCAAFAGACLERAGERSTRSLLARSYLSWGEAESNPVLGAVAVLSRSADPAQGHVGFVVGSQEDKILLIGGNQRNAVTIEAFDRSRLLGLRWPSRRAAGGADGDAGDIFETALKHVLEMEGGYTDDPFDPGGPTNLGITLAVYAAHRDADLTPDTAASLKAELKALKVAAAREIYLSRYWAPSKAALLPAAVALMHFDAAVNHGVANAARMLQQAARVAVDGEIGPQTLQAVRRAETRALLRRYAEIRRARYRSLGHFWRFGRGWLARVDRTLAAAERLAGVPTPNVQSQATHGDKRMAEPSASQPPTKWWGQSITIWGAVITALSSVLPVLGPLVGIDISADLVRQLGDEVVRVIQAAGGLIGIIMTIYGRSRASAPLERRQVTVQI